MKTPLVLTASIPRREDILRLLLDAGADPTAEDVVNIRKRWCRETTLCLRICPWYNFYPSSMMMSVGKQRFDWSLGRLRNKCKYPPSILWGAVYLPSCTRLITTTPLPRSTLLLTLRPLRRSYLFPNGLLLCVCEFRLRTWIGRCTWPRWASATMCWKLCLPPQALE